MPTTFASRRVLRAAVPCFFASAVMSACQTQGGPGGGHTGAVAVPDSRIFISHTDLAQNLVFDPPIEVRKDGLLTVAVPTQSLGRDRYILDYRYVWFDSDGIEVRPAMSWKEIVLEPGGKRQLSANALDSRAQSWKLEIRWANR